MIRLNRGGHLFLGESESIGTFSDLFTPVDARHKIFRRKPVPTAYEPEMAERVILHKGEATGHILLAFEDITGRGQKR